MSQDCGAFLVFGVLLSEKQGPEMAVFLQELGDYLALRADGGFDELDMTAWDSEAREVLKACGVHAPDTARLYYTGSEDERPARCCTPSESFILGFGGFTPPLEWEKSHKASEWSFSFREAAEFWNWVWMA